MAHRLLIAAVVLVMVAASAPAAEADDRVQDDPAGDNRHGHQSAILDIARVSHTHVGRKTLVHRVSTYDEWDTSILPKEGFVGSGQIEFRLTVDQKTLVVTVHRHEDGGVYGTMTAGGRDFQDTLKYVPAWRPDRTSVEIKFPVGYLMSPRLPVRAYTWSAYTSDRNCYYATSSDTIASCDDQSEPIVHHIAECEDGADNDRDGTSDMQDGGCVWPGQLYEDEAYVGTTISIRYGARANRLKGRLQYVPIVDPATGASYTPSYDGCLTARYLTITLITDGTKSEVEGMTQWTTSARWVLPLRGRARPDRARVYAHEISIGTPAPEYDTFVCGAARSRTIRL